MRTSFKKIIITTIIQKSRLQNIKEYSYINELKKKATLLNQAFYKYCVEKQSKYHANIFLQN